ncbi:MAG: hypothetical protein KDA58_06595 [Planctomycetaceae bacterium]|nr:hypothetical protein [Planctomycetaceae bacterium]
MSLQQQLDRLRSRLRRRLLLRGHLLWAGAMVLGMIVAGTIDWCLQPVSSLLRGLLFLLLVSWLLYAVWKWLLGCWLQRLTLREVAFQLERLDPSWQGHLAVLASTLDRVPSGSPPAVGVPPGPALGPVEHELMLPRLRSVPLLFAALPLLLGIAALFTLQLRAPHTLQIGLARLCLPTESIRWPRQAELQLVTSSGDALSPGRPLQVSTRQPLTLFVVDQEGAPPNEVVWSLKLPDGRVEQHTLRADAQTSETRVPSRLRFSWMPTPGTSWVRVQGGDDHTMNWCPIESLSAPVLLQTETALEYPEYLGLPPNTLPALPARLSLPTGTQVTIHGQFDRPVKTLIRHTSTGEIMPLELDPGGTSFSHVTNLAADQRMVFWFEARDEASRVDPRPPRHELLAIPDKPPETRLLTPNEDQYLTPQALVPWSIQLSDDYGVRQARVRLLHDDQETVLWSGDWPRGAAAPSHITGLLQLSEQSLDDPAFAHLTASAEISTIPAPEQGSELRLSVEAFDHAPGPDRTGGLSVRRLRIVSPREKLNELHQLVTQQAAILERQAEELIAR